VVRTGAKHPLVVGDRLDTDIEGANRVGLDSLLVFTGVTDPVGAIIAPVAQRPTYLAEDLAGLLEPHPTVASQGETYRCGGWTAHRDGDRLDLDGPRNGGDRIDGLRALCAAAWAADGVTAESARAAVRQLDNDPSRGAAAG
jgi:glycerol-1-phosphatase